MLVGDCNNILDNKNISQSSSHGSYSTNTFTNIIDTIWLIDLVFIENPYNLFNKRYYLTNLKVKLNKAFTN